MSVAHIRTWTVVGLMTASGTLACQESPLSTVPPDGPVEAGLLEGGAEIVDAAHSAEVDHFYFLPPLVSNPSYTGTFAGTLLPEVDICELDEVTLNCPVIATYTMTTGPGSETVRVELLDELYIVNWHTDEFNLDPQSTYRIVVRVGADPFGWADVDVVNNGNELKNVDTGEYIALKDGRTLPIKFRIEEGAGPVLVGVWASITTGFRHTCGVTTDGTGHCWGSNGRGEGGLGASGGFNTSPQPIAGGLTFDEIKAASGEFTCSLTNSSDVYCWGTGVNGQLGSSTVALIGCGGTCSPDPVLVEGGITWSAIGGGEDHYACALDSGGAAYCWGNIGQGDVPGSVGSSDVPVPVQGGITFESLDIGDAVCGVTPSGDAYCWHGTNNNGEFGDGTMNDSNFPVLVTGGHTFTQVAVAGLFACGLTDTGQALCWGSNSYGQLGVDPVTGPQFCGTNPCSLSPVAVTGGLTFTKISANGTSFHRGNVCGIATDGDTYCWGNNTEGQLGDGTIGGTRHTPVPVVGGHQFVDIAVTHGHACGVTVSGDAYCWGNNAAGQLGDGTQITSGTPVQVIDPM